MSIAPGITPPPQPPMLPPHLLQVILKFVLFSFIYLIIYITTFKIPNPSYVLNEVHIFQLNNNKFTFYYIPM